MQEAEEREEQTRKLVQELNEKFNQKTKQNQNNEVEQLRRDLEEERRLRELEKRDYEVRLQGLLNTSSPARASAHEPDSAAGTEIEAAKEQLRVTLEKDFAIRRSMETRRLDARIAELESKLASTSTSVNSYQEDEEKEGLCRKLEELEAELDRRFEELADVRNDLETMAKEKEEAESRIAELEQGLGEDQGKLRDRSDSAREEELVEEINTLQEQLFAKEEQMERLEETLSLTQSRLEGVLVKCDVLTHQSSMSQGEEPAQILEIQEEASILRERVASLERHIVSLEMQLRAHHSPASTPSKTEQTSWTTPAAEKTMRQSKLEKELANLNLELVKLSKANEALQEDNINFSIALSAKQLELGMVKRNARFALKKAHAHEKGNTSHHIELPLSKTIQISAQPMKEPEKAEKVEDRVWPSVPTGKLGGDDKENQPMQEKAVNSARANARALLAQRRALGQTSNGGGGQDMRQRLALLA